MQATFNMVESFKRARIIDSVTSDDDKFTPIYKLDEVCELIQASSVDAIREIVDYLIKTRLESRSPHVKQKVLRLIKYLSPKAGRDFKRELQRHAPSIRALSHYSGQPDPLKADAPNKAVRDTAKEAITALFHEEEDHRSTITTSSNGSFQETPGKRRMEGFGNGSQRTDSLGSSSFRPSGRSVSAASAAVGTVVEFGTDSIKMGLDMLGQLSKPRSTQQRMTDDMSDGHYVAPRESGDLDSTSRHSYSHGSNHESYPRSREPSRTLHEDNPGSDPWQNGDRHTSRTPAGSDEERLVESVTQPGGVRAQPTRDALQAFVRSVQKMDGRAVGTALESRLRNPSWQIRLKALCFLEASLRNEGDPACDDMYTFFVSDPGAILLNLEGVHASVRDKAKRVAELLELGVHQTPPEPSSTAVPAPVQAAPQPEQSFAVPDLLDLDDSASPTPQPTGGDFLQGDAPAGGPLAGNSADNDLLNPFEGLSVHEPSPVGRPEVEDDLFSGLNVDDKSSSLPGSDPFLDLSSSSPLGSNPPNTPASQNPLPVKSTANILDAYSAAPSTFPVLPQLSHSGVGVQPGPVPQLNSISAMAFPAYPPALPVMPLQQQQQFLMQQQMLYMQQAMSMGVGPGFLPGFNPMIAPYPVQQQPQISAVGMQRVGLGEGHGHGHDFDFSGNATIKATVSSPAKEDTSAFDFIQDHLKSVSKPSRRGL